MDDVGVGVNARPVVDTMMLAYFIQKGFVRFKVNPY